MQGQLDESAKGRSPRWRVMLVIFLAILVAMAVIVCRREMRAHALQNEAISYLESIGGTIDKEWRGPDWMVQYTTHNSAWFSRRSDDIELTSDENGIRFVINKHSYFLTANAERLLVDRQWFDIQINHKTISIDQNGKITKAEPSPTGLNPYRKPLSGSQKPRGFFE